MPRPSSFSSSSSFVAIWQTWIYFNLAKDLRALLRAYFFNLLLNNFFLSLSCLLTVIHLTLSYLGEKSNLTLETLVLSGRKMGLGELQASFSPSSSFLSWESGKNIEVTFLSIRSFPAYPHNLAKSCDES